MANRRSLKHTINRQSFELISDAFSALKNRPGIDREKVMKLVDETVEIRNSLIGRLNKIGSLTDPGAQKMEYKTIREDLDHKMNACFAGLSKLITTGK